MKSTVGRPRLVTDAQIARILEWHDALMAWKAQRKTLLTVCELARELQLSRGTIHDVVRSRGQLKQPSPEHREAERALRRQRMRQIREPSAR